MALVTVVGFPSLAQGTPIETIQRGDPAEPGNIEENALPAGDFTKPGNVDKDGLPTGAKTFLQGSVFAAEHELLHGIGFSTDYSMFSTHIDKNPNVDGTRNFKDNGGKVIAILTPKAEGTHIQTGAKLPDGTEQARGIMDPDPDDFHAGDFEKSILNAAFDWTGKGGIKITANFTGSLADAEKAKTDRKAIDDVITRIQNLFGSKSGVEPRKFTWDVEKDVCAPKGDPPEVEDLPCTAVPESPTFYLAAPGLLGAAFFGRNRIVGRRGSRRVHTHF
jgi:hypothetical protein